MGERRPLNVRVDEDVVDDFREFTEESKGQIRGEMGRLVEKAMIEYMDNDRSARIERKVDELPEKLVDALSEELLERERRKSETESENGSPSSPTSPSSPGNKTEERLARVVREMPDNTAVSEAMLETPIENHAGSSPKTLDKYKRLLKKRGHILDHPTDPDKFVTSARKFAIICENNERVTPEQLDSLVGHYEELLGEDWYLEALPDDLIRNTTLKYETITDISEYREANGLLDDRLGVQ